MDVAGGLAPLGMGHCTVGGVQLVTALDPGRVVQKAC